eukprot:2678291-Pleurochrysis_carterae.AAC.1
MAAQAKPATRVMLSCHHFSWPGKSILRQEEQSFLYPWCISSRMCSLPARSGHLSRSVLFLLLAMRTTPISCNSANTGLLEWLTTRGVSPQLVRTFGPTRSVSQMLALCRALERVQSTFVTLHARIVVAETEQPYKCNAMGEGRGQTDLRVSKWGSHVFGTAPPLRCAFGVSLSSCSRCGSSHAWPV